MPTGASDLATALDAHRAGDLVRAERMYRDIGPSPDALHLLGVVCCQTGRLDEGVALIEAAIEAGLEDPAAYANLGAACLAAGKPERAVEALLNAARQAPNAITIANLGAALVLVDRPEKAIAWLIDYQDDPSALTTLGRAYFQLERFEEAAMTTRRAVARGAGAPALANLCQIERSLGDIDAAIEAGEAALTLDPTLEEARLNLAGAYGIAGDWAKKVALLDGLSLSLTNASARLMALHYRPDHDAATLRREAEEYGRRFPCQPRPSARRGVVGFVTGDARRHPVGRWLIALLRRLPLETVVYHSHRGDDDVSEAIREYCIWRSIVGVDDQSVAEQIACDGVDLLIDLSGHTGYNRLPLFATRPARIQASAIGWFGTTGLDAMDFFLADDVLAPPASDGDFVESVLRMPNGLYAFDAPDGGPVARRNGATVFGYFGSLMKMNSIVAREWARLMHLLPGARLLVHRSELRHATAQRLIAGLLSDAGIPADRVEFRAGGGLDAYYASLSECHLVLDTWPFSSGTCAFDALWMGVPIVAWSGERLTGRMSRSILIHSDFERWAADDWVQGCLAALEERIQPSEIRDRVAASCLMDCDRYAVDFVQAIETMRNSI